MLRISWITGCLLSLVTLMITGAANAQEKVATERTLTQRTGWSQFANVSPQKLADEVRARKARIVDLDVNSASPLRLSATLVSNSGPHQSGWWWYHGQTADQLKQKLRDNKARLIDLDIYRVNGKLRFAAVMVPNTGDKATGWWWYYGQTAEQLNQKLQENKARLVDIERYSDGNKTRFAAIMVRNTGAKASQWWWYYGQTRDQLRNHISSKKARILDIEQYNTRNGKRFAVILVPNDGNRPMRWWYYHGTSAKDLLIMARRHGARLVDIEPPSGGAKRYAGIMVDNGMTRNGDCGGRQMASFDRQVVNAMKRYQIPGASVAVMKGDRLVYACAFGYANLDKNVKVKPEHRFRLASISKPITVSAIRKLEADNRLEFGDSMLDRLGNARPAAPYKDDKLENITIQHLLDHEGGWDRDESFDPMFRPGTIANALGVNAPATCRNVIRYMFQTQDLDFRPGRKDVYSNFGYCILGRIVEARSGQTYEAYVRDKILKPIGITKMRIGRSRLKNRRGNQVQYYNTPFAAKVDSVFPGDPEKVEHPDGGFHLEAMDSHGGWIASAIDTARFARFANPRPYGTSWFHNGSLRGTWTRVETNGDVTVAVLFNSRADFETDEMIDRAIGGVRVWPTKDLWEKYGY